MKQTFQEKTKRINFEPGHITKDGFLGTDERHIHDIIRADEMTLARLGIDIDQIAERMQAMIEKGKEGLESPVQSEVYLIQVQWDRGMLPCPFGERGLHHKLVVTVSNEKLNRSIRFSQLSVHMIRAHGFFGGKGSLFRIEPEEIVRILDVRPDQSAGGKNEKS
jgi:hypothetical protein